MYIPHFNIIEHNIIYSENKELKACWANSRSFFLLLECNCWEIYIY